jgi:CubicO group peptidase (beta-lactamase class C family)
MKWHHFLLTAVIPFFLACATCNRIAGTSGSICKNGYCLNIKTFADSLKKELDGKVVKYAFVIRYQLLQEARSAGTLRENANLPDSFTIYTRYNPASVTKKITAVAVLQLLNRKHLSIQDKIWPYLPASWNIPASIKNITFRQILTHQGGIRFDVFPPDYAAVQTSIENGIDPADTLVGKYNNMNFAICRILVDYLDGYNAASFTDQAAGTGGYFINYLQKNIFDTLGFKNVLFKPALNSQLLFYPYPVNNDPGSDYGDWSLFPGSAGVQISTWELATFIYYLRYTNSLLPEYMKTQMFDGLLGWDVRTQVSGDEFIFKNGVFPVPPWSTAIINFTNGLQVTIAIDGNINSVDAVTTAYQKAWVKSN